jgi:hypothetical protein
MPPPGSAKELAEKRCPNCWKIDHGMAGEDTVCGACVEDGRREWVMLFLRVIKWC